jgi:hypothetical protein
MSTHVDSCVSKDACMCVSVCVCVCVYTCKPACMCACVCSVRENSKEKARSHSDLYLLSNLQPDPFFKK